MNKLTIIYREQQKIDCFDIICYPTVISLRDKVGNEITTIPYDQLIRIKAIKKDKNKIKTFKRGDIVSCSADRSSHVDFYAKLLKKRKDLSSKFQKEDGLVHEIWVASENPTTDDVIVERVFNNSSLAEFAIVIFD